MIATESRRARASANRRRRPQQERRPEGSYHCHQRYLRSPCLTIARLHWTQQSGCQSSVIHISIAFSTDNRIFRISQFNRDSRGVERKLVIQRPGHAAPHPTSLGSTKGQAFRSGASAHLQPLVSTLFYPSQLHDIEHLARVSGRPLAHVLLRRGSEYTRPVQQLVH